MEEGNTLCLSHDIIGSGAAVFAVYADAAAMLVVYACVSFVFYGRKM